MRINWGIKITLLYVGFVALIVIMVGMAMHQQVDLVSKDYYEQELKFQDKINYAKNANDLPEPMTWKLEPGELSLLFPKQFSGQQINGSVYFFRPSDANMDLIVALPGDTSTVQKILTNTLHPGVYKMQVSWLANDVTYYNEGVIRIN